MRRNRRCRFVRTAEKKGKEEGSMSEDRYKVTCGMGDDALCWKTLSSRTILNHPIMEIVEKEEQTSGGVNGRYVAIKTRNWVIAVPVHDGKFVMVRQWRHGYDGITVEFPGGVAESGETPEEGAARELYE